MARVYGRVTLQKINCFEHTKKVPLGGANQCGTIKEILTMASSLHLHALVALATMSATHTHAASIWPAPASMTADAKTMSIEST